MAALQSMQKIKIVMYKCTPGTAGQKLAWMLLEWGECRKDPWEWAERTLNLRCQCNRWDHVTSRQKIDEPFLEVICFIFVFPFGNITIYQSNLLHKWASVNLLAHSSNSPILEIKEWLHFNYSNLGNVFAAGLTSPDISVTFPISKK